ncbi:MAG TPA: DUF2917 domain-containing protein [Ramlibacter sp.]|nr:DUF2917 domain-containing protein [Ramlibacter sp.]
MHLALTSFFLPPAAASSIASQALAPGATLRRNHAAGVQVRCVSGSVWVTQDGDTRDVLLAAGESFTGDRRGRLLVHALEASRVDIG